MFEIPIDSFSAYTEEKLCAPNVDVKGQYFTINVTS